MKGLTLLGVSIVLLTNLIYSQSVDIKDGSANTLIQINDEGNAGSITIPDATTVGTTTNKLYNESGTLKWSGSALGLSGSTGGWTDDGSIVRLSTLSDRIGIGVISPHSLSNVEIFRQTAGVPLFINNHRGGMAFYPASNITYGLLTSVASNDADIKFGIVTNALGDGGTKYAIWADANGAGTNWAGYFNGGNVYVANQVGIGTATPSAKLDVSGDIVLGESGSRFLEIQEVTGTTGVSNAVTIPNALPDGWTGSNTRVLSFEIQYGSATGNWVTVGNDFINTQPSISASLGYASRTIILYYPDLAAYQNQSWRMVIMKMPS
jgi:hypothetical protein